MVMQLPLVDSELHLVFVTLDGEGDYSTMLSEEEQQRASRFVRPQHGARFRLAHAALRHVLGLALDTPAAQLAFQNETTGKPMLPAWPDIGFNLSHAEDLALIALGRGTRVGVDIEHSQRGCDWLGIAESFFSLAERKLITAAEDSGACFLRLWTAKEAVLKAIGSGLSALESVEMTLDSEDRPRLHSVKHLAWRLHTLTVAGNHPAALAYDGPPRTIRTWRLHHTTNAFHLIEEKIDVHTA
ncbi:4'-phosphopantetheinyl transferase superfamily protein [Chitinimonas sp. BJB300]|nr:4'-phosphopantetheinyl transferase superfamily protein [Chitinimonas sp. BJB300]